MCDTLTPFLETSYSLSQLALGIIWVTRAAGLRQMWARAAGRDQLDSSSLQQSHSGGVLYQTFQHACPRGKDTQCGFSSQASEFQS